MKNRFCFIDYEDVRDADEAIKAMDGRTFDGETITVDRPKGKENHGRGFRPERSEWRVRVENIPPRVHWQALKDKFRRCGEVVFGDIYKDAGYLEFRHKSDMYYALDHMHLTDWFGYTLHVFRANPVDLSKRERDKPREEKRDRSSSPRRSRSNSRDRSRSPKNRKESSKAKKDENSPSRSRSDSPVVFKREASPRSEDRDHHRQDLVLGVQ